MTPSPHDQVAAATRTVDDLEREQRDAAQRYKLGKEKAIESIASALAEMPDIERWAAAHDLYYGESWINSTALAHSLHTTVQQLPRILGPVEIPNYVCPDCGGPVFCTSRTDLQNTLTRIRGMRGGKPKFRHYPPPRCERCETAARAASSQRYAVAARQENARLADLRSMPYSDYLATDHWADIRRRALKRSGFACQVCNEGGVLDVHHRTYDRRGQEHNTDVIVLCRSCHARHHGKVEAR